MLSEEVSFAKQLKTSVKWDRKSNEEYSSCSWKLASEWKFAFEGCQLTKQRARRASSISLAPTASWTSHDVATCLTVDVPAQRRETLPRDAFASRRVDLNSVFVLSNPLLKVFYIQLLLNSRVSNISRPTQTTFFFLLFVNLCLTLVNLIVSYNLRTTYMLFNSILLRKWLSQI